MPNIPHVVVQACGFTCLTSLLVSSLAIYLQVTNYRKMFEQRLVVRILLVVPMFAVTCYICLVNYTVGAFLEPVREIYEAFVIYTFYKLLVLLLGGEARIIQEAQSKPPVSHFFPASLFLHKVEMSDPKQFLTIKRCILQYVWMKPLLIVIIAVSSALGCYDVNDVSLTSVFFWVGIAYNMSVTISLYYLALFWKCLYDDLKQFDPWPKFLCVKLIIFASYWQGLLIGVLNWLGVFHDELGSEHGTNLGLEIQNALLCLEMVFFAWFHWRSFPYSDFSSDRLPDAARLQTWAAMKDWISIGDLLHDLRATTMYGDAYNFRNFDSVNDTGVYNESDVFNRKIYQGLRVTQNGTKHWIPGIGDPKSSAVANSRTAGSPKSIASQVFLGRPDQKTPLLATSPHTSSPPNNHNYSASAMRRSQSQGSSASSTAAQQGTQPQIEFEDVGNEDFSRDERLYQYVKRHYLTDAKINYPVEYDYREIEYSNKIVRMRQQLARGTNEGMV